MAVVVATEGVLEQLGQTQVEEGHVQKPGVCQGLDHGHGPHLPVVGQLGREDQQPKGLGRQQGQG